MLAGLLFAKDDADDRPDTLTATLPFGGGTLIEYQARLLVAAGAAQIIVAVTRTTPELIGAINRIARRGVSVDVVRTAAEALEKAHPLATIVLIADGLITTEAIVAGVAREEGDAMLVTDDAHAVPGLERLDSETLWAGIARLGPRRLADAARLPEEYDLQSTLLRVVAQGHPTWLDLPSAALAEGHGIERDSRRLVQRSRRALGARLSRRRAWIDRFVLTPLGRLALPTLIDRRVPATAMAGLGGVLALVGWALLVLRWPVTAMLLECLSVVAFSLGHGLSWLRDEERQAGWCDGAIRLVAVVTTVLLGFVVSREAQTGTGWLAAAAALVVGALLERVALPAERRTWWGSPAAYVLVEAVLTILGAPLAGLVLTAGYGAAGLADAIEKLREKP